MEELQQPDQGAARSKGAFLVSYTTVAAAAAAFLLPIAGYWLYSKHGRKGRADQSAEDKLSSMPTSSALTTRAQAVAEKAEQSAARDLASCPQFYGVPGSIAGKHAALASSKTMSALPGMFKDAQAEAIQSGGGPAGTAAAPGMEVSTAALTNPSSAATRHGPSSMGHGASKQPAWHPSPDRVHSFPVSPEVSLDEESVAALTHGGGKQGLPSSQGQGKPPWPLVQRVPGIVEAAEPASAHSEEGFEDASAQPQTLASPVRSTRAAGTTSAPAAPGGPPWLSRAGRMAHKHHQQQQQQHALADPRSATSSLITSSSCGSTHSFPGSGRSMELPAAGGAETQMVSAALGQSSGPGMPTTGAAAGSGAAAPPGPPASRGGTPFYSYTRTSSLRHSPLMAVAEAAEQSPQQQQPPPMAHASATQPQLEVLGQAAVQSPPYAHSISAPGLALQLDLTALLQGALHDARRQAGSPTQGTVRRPPPRRPPPVPPHTTQRSADRTLASYGLPAMQAQHEAPDPGSGTSMAANVGDSHVPHAPSWTGTTQSPMSSPGGTQLNSSPSVTELASMLMPHVTHTSDPLAALSRGSTATTTPAGSSHQWQLPAGLLHLQPVTASQAPSGAAAALQQLVQQQQEALEQHGPHPQPRSASAPDRRPAHRAAGPAQAMTAEGHRRKSMSYVRRSVCYQSATKHCVHSSKVRSPQLRAWSCVHGASSTA